MPYIAELQIKVDSSQVESATQKLKEFAQATTSSAAAESSARKTKADSANKVEASEKKASKAEQSRYDKWFEMAARRDKEEATLASRRDAIMARDVKDSAASVARKQKAAAQEAAAEEKRYNQWLQNADKKAQTEARLAAVADATRKKAMSSTVGSGPNAEIKAQKDALAEQQRIDKIRYQSTLRRFSEEEKAAAGAVKASTKAASAIDQEAKALNNLLGAIDPVTREMSRLNALETTLKANFDKGKINAAEYTKYQKVIDETRESVNKYNTALNKTGITAKQVRLAQQNLPAQFTDILVSLQGGQAPLTVLLQQGGQIKDMFGGVGNALKGVAGAIMPMINPMTLAAAAMGTLAIAWYDGSNQLTKLNSAIIQNGNAIGMSAGLLRQYASANGDSLGSIRENIDALSQLVANGNLVPSTYDKVAEAATSMANVSGVALDKILEDFTSLGKDPVAAAEKLNEKYNFLTASVHAQAQALISQGKEQEATKLLTLQLADVVETRAKLMEDAATGVAKAWREVKNAVSDAWSSIGEGLNPTVEYKLAQVNAQIEDYARGRDKEDYENTYGYQHLLSKRKELVDQLYELRTADETDTQNKIKNAAAIAAQTEALKKEQAGWSAVKKAKEELRMFDLTLAKAGNKLTPEYKVSSRQPFLDAIKKAEEAEAKKLDANTPNSAILDNRDVNELGNKINEIKAHYAELTQAVKSQQEAGTLSAENGFTKRQQLLTEETAKIKATYQEQITALEALKSSKNISANQSISLDRQIADARSKMVVAETEAQKNLDKTTTEEEKRLKRKQHNVDAYNDSLQQMILNLKVAGARDIAGISMASGQRGVNDQLNSEDDRYANEVRDLRNQAAENPQLANEVDQKLTAAATAHTAMKNQIVQNYDDMNAAERDWQAGLTSAFKQYIEDGQKFATITNQAFTNVFTSMEDAIVGFVSTGKMSFSDLTRSILADLARIAVKAAASSALSAIIGGIGAAGTASAGSTAAGYSSAFLSGWAGVQQAKGGGWEGGKQFFAKGGAFTNSVVSKPTNFNIGEMGEKGPEAIMPLTRASDGSLGVRASVDTAGLAGAAGNSVQVIVNVDGQGNSTTSASDAGFSSFGQDIGQFVDQRYRTLMSKDLQPGGDIWKTMNG